MTGRWIVHVDGRREASNLGRHVEPPTSEGGEQAPAGVRIPSASRGGPQREDTRQPTIVRAKASMTQATGQTTIPSHPALLHSTVR